MRVMIVDDEAPARSELRFLLEETGRVEAITEAASAREAVEQLMKDQTIDVLFMDISMPGVSGVSLADALRRLKNPPIVIFVTAYSEFALEAFNVDAIDYLVKPVETDRLSQALDKADEQIDSRMRRNKLQSRLNVERAGRRIFIPIEDIRYIESKDDYSCIYTADDRYLSTMSLASLEERLESFGFFRAHRGFIVALQYIDEVDITPNGTLQITIKDYPEVSISVSRRRVAPLKSLLGIEK